MPSLAGWGEVAGVVAWDVAVDDTVWIEDPEESDGLIVGSSSVVPYPLLSSASSYDPVLRCINCAGRGGRGGFDGSI